MARPVKTARASPNVDVLFGNETEAATVAETEGWEEKDVGVHREEACRSPEERVASLAWW